MDVAESTDLAVEIGCSSSLPCVVHFDLEGSPLTSAAVETVAQLEMFLKKVVTPLNSTPTVNVARQPTVSSNSSSSTPSKPTQPSKGKSKSRASEIGSLPCGGSKPIEASSDAACEDSKPIEASSDAALRAACEALVKEGTCVRLFVAGDKTHCGKSSVALGILGALHRAGVPACKLGYIKPATQCEAPDLMNKWCSSVGVAHVAGADAPLVFFKGFTREFLKGHAGTSQEWLDKVAAAVDALARGKSFVVVDGVGFPAVGSVVGVSNLEVAKAARAPVVLVGKCGVGEAIDGYTLNSAYFRHGEVPVLGAVFNRGALSGFYNHLACAESILAFFEARKPREAVFGVVPELSALEGTRELIPDMTDGACAQLADACVSHMAEHVDVAALLHAAAADPWNRRTPASGVDTSFSASFVASSSSLPPSRQRFGFGTGDGEGHHLAASPPHTPPSAAEKVQAAVGKRSRAEIEAEAAALGATGG